MLAFFFFSSRRRHTRYIGDWSSDVCSSDRVKELIKYKGYQVAPAELEAVLIGNPEIADAAVIGVKDEATGEELPKAFIVRAPGSSISEQDVMDYAASRLAPHKKIRAVEFIEAVPKSAA